MDVELRHVTKMLLTVVWAVSAAIVISLVVRLPSEFSGHASFQEILSATTRDPVALLIVVPIAAIIVACVLAIIGRRNVGVHVMLFAVVTLLPLALLITLIALWMFVLLGLFGGYPAASPPGGPPGSMLDLQLLLLGSYGAFLHVALCAYLLWVAFVVTICEVRRTRLRTNVAA